MFPQTELKDLLNVKVSAPTVCPQKSPDSALKVIFLNMKGIKFQNFIQLIADEQLFGFARFK